MFSVIRGKGGHRDNPNAMQFRASFRYLVVEKLFLQSENSNCKIDYDNILLDLSCVTSTGPVTSSALATTTGNVTQPDLTTSGHSAPSSCVETPASEPASKVVELPGSDLNQMTTPPPNLEEENVVSYITGYLIKKLNMPKKCENCQFEFNSSSKPNTDRFTFVGCKSFKDGGCLVYPNEDLCKILDQLEVLFKGLFPHLLAARGVKLTLNTHAKEVCTNTGIACAKCEDKISDMARIYMSLRVHHKLDSVNKMSTQLQGTKRKNRKMEKLLHGTM